MTRSEYERICRRLTDAAAREATGIIEKLAEIGRRLGEADLPSVEEIRRMQSSLEADHARLLSALDQHDAAQHELDREGFSPDPTTEGGRP